MRLGGTRTRALARTTAARAALAGALALAACDAQVTADYHGEELVRLRGNVVSNGGAPPSEAALLWWTAAGDPASDGVATRVTTAGQFPASFALSLYRSPPERAVLPLAAPGLAPPAINLPELAGGLAPTCIPPLDWVSAGPAGLAALATVAAVRPGVPDAELADAVVGTAEGIALAYVPDSPGARSGGPGDYRLLRIEWRPEGGPGAFACTGGPTPFMRLVESYGGLDGTEIEIRFRAD